jgi:Ca2+-binding EF-hand superfamily protein
MTSSVLSAKSTKAEFLSVCVIVSLIIEMFAQYVEPESASLLLFNILDIVRTSQTHDGLITAKDLSTAYSSMSLRPGPAMLKRILSVVKGPCTFERFREMRVSKLKCELNALAELKKFDVHPTYRGIVTAECVDKVLREEGASQVEALVQEFMLCDRNLDGYVSYKDIYDWVLSLLPPDWDKWLVEK